MKRSVCLLGATGSIGASSLDLIAQHADHFRLSAISANTDIEGVLAIVRRFSPPRVAMADPAAADRLREKLQAEGFSKTEVMSGPEGLCHLAADPQVDLVIAGIVGVAGLEATWAAAEAGKTILLANKEALVCAGSLLIKTCLASGANILPIDSEHNAIFQCLGPDYRCFHKPKHVERLLLTASGGPFRTWSAADIQVATVAQAVNHPNWSMGQKISVDSATMMNKGLEFIEAHWLFSMPADQIEIIVHPESIIHSMVAFHDGSILAQLGAPDMRTPIAYAMGWPARIASRSDRLDWTQLSALHFERPDPVKFPAIRLARQALDLGMSAAICLNAANEVAVASFLKGAISFGQLMVMVEGALDRWGSRFPQPGCVNEVLEIDAEVRRCLSRGASC